MVYRKLNRDWQRFLNSVNLGVKVIFTAYLDINIIGTYYHA
jgi:hypothetical protein